MRSLDRIARIVMLVLAGLVSLSIIGAIAAIPSGTIEGRIGIAPELPPDSGSVPRPEEASAPEPRPEGASGPTGEGLRQAGPGPAPARHGDPVQWLEAITYTLLALIGLAALAILLLWQGVRERRRVADALERLAGCGE